MMLPIFSLEGVMYFQLPSMIFMIFWPLEVHILRWCLNQLKDGEWIYQWMLDLGVNLFRREIFNFLGKPVYDVNFPLHLMTFNSENKF